MYVKHVRGRGGEALAAGYLELIGLTVIARNTRFAGVEVDLVALDGETHVLVEVKLRSRSDYGGAAQAVDARKRGRLLRAARTLGEVPVRVDLIAIELVDGGLGLRHYRNAFTE